MTEDIHCVMQKLGGGDKSICSPLVKMLGGRFSPSTPGLISLTLSGKKIKKLNLVTED